MKKKIYLVCATGIATSSMLRMKIQEYLEDRGIEVDLTTYRVAEMFPDRIEADLIVATTSMPPEVEEKVKCISGLPLLTGIGEEQVFEEIYEAIKD